jgi:trigger factor
MNIVETLNEGLKRAFTITIPASEIDGKVDAQLKTMAPRIKMPGFRPARCPQTWCARCTARRCSRRR